MKKTSEDLVDVQDLWHKLVKDITCIEQQEDTNPAGSFGHLFGGYESQYYGYLWS
jgi:Zn-dependent oligopeptidase